MAITITEATKTGMDPRTVQRLSQRSVVIFDFEDLMRSRRCDWQETIGNETTFLAINHTPPGHSGATTEVMLYSGHDFAYDDLRRALTRRGQLTEIIGMITVDFPLGHEGSICFLDREVPEGDPAGETIGLFAALIENITPRLLPVKSGIYGEGRAHIVMERYWKGMVNPPDILNGYGGIAVDPQEGSFVILGRNGYVIGMANHDGDVIWGGLN